MTNRVIVKVSPEWSWMWNRNGCPPLAELHAWWGRSPLAEDSVPQLAYVDGVNRRGDTLENAGFQIPAEQMDELCQKWLELRRKSRWSPLDAKVRQAAIDEYVSKGVSDVEIDDHPEISYGDEGSFVQAWVWVANSAVGLESEAVDG